MKGEGVGELSDVLAEGEIVFGDYCFLGEHFMYSFNCEIFDFYYFVEVGYLGLEVSDFWLKVGGFCLWGRVIGHFSWYYACHYINKCLNSLFSLKPLKVVLSFLFCGTWVWVLAKRGGGWIRAAKKKSENQWIGERESF